jgi:hypothetical protein
VRSDKEKKRRRTAIPSAVDLLFGTAGKAEQSFSLAGSRAGKREAMEMDDLDRLPADIWFWDRA